MIIQINADTLRALMERSGVFDDFTCDAEDYVWDQMGFEEFEEFDDMNDGMEGMENLSYEELTDVLRYTWHCYWPGREEERLDVWDFYYDFISPENLYTPEEFEGICDVNNHDYDSARLYLWENLNAEVLKDGSIVTFE